MTTSTTTATTTTTTLVASTKPKRRSTAMKDPTATRTRSPTDRGVWSAEEHDKFLIGIKTFPNGPWKMIAEQIGTRSARQVQTHAQKYYEKVARRLRGLRKHRKKLARPEHRLGDDMMRMCAVATPSDPTSASTNASLDVGMSAIGRGRLDLHLSPLRTALLPPLTMVEATDGLINDVKLAICASPLFLTAAKSAPVASATSSPKGVDTVAEPRRMEGGVTFNVKLEPSATWHSEYPPSFASLLSGGGTDSFVNLDSLDSLDSLDPFELELDVDVDVDVDVDSSSDAGSDWSSDSASSVGDDTADVDDADSVVDFEDRYLDFLMEVLDADMTQPCDSSFLLPSFGV